MRVAFFGGSHQLSFKTLFLRRLPKNIQEFPPKPNLPINFRFFLQGPKVLKRIHQKNMQSPPSFRNGFPLPNPTTDFLHSMPKPQDPYPFASSTFRWDLSRCLFVPSHRCLVLCLLQYPLFFRGFNPFETYARQIGSFPQVGMKIKHN